MSFIIKTNASSAFATSGVQEKHAHDRHTARKAIHPVRHGNALGDSCDLTHLDTGAAAIREEAAFQALLNEHLSFLETQDAALGQIQELFVTRSEREDFLDVFEGLTGEKFNGSELFTREGEEQALHMLVPQSAETVCIRRPLIGTGSSTPSLRESVSAAREENHKEQAQLREIAASVKIRTDLHMVPVKILDSESARETTGRSQRSVLSDASTALGGQANSAHEAVLRLFS
jgi:hypothetical protein